MPQGREARYTAEYVMLKYPGARVVLNMPIGPIPTEALEGRTVTAAAAFARPMRPRVDAIVIEPELLTLVEAENWESRRAVSDLSFYKPLIPLTPELQPYLDRPLRLLAVVPEMPSWLPPIAEAHGIDVDTYAPDWLADIVTRNANYHTKEYRDRRAARNELLDKAGLR